MTQTETEDINKETPLIFVLSWNRPIYLWVCLDSIYRHTKHSCKIVLADNNSSDPLVHQVIDGFEKRGLFHAVHRYSDNDPFRFKKLIKEYWDEIEKYFVLVEADIEIIPTTSCWLNTLVNHMERDETIGSIGSRVYQKDFVSIEEAKKLQPNASIHDLNQLIKSHAPMRDYKHTEEPLICPHNPPLRLLLMRKKAYQKIEFGRDTEIHQRLIQQGYQSLISTEVVHRHLSLLNIYDYSDFSNKARDIFFDKQKEHSD
jgi:GT2 family glycosyltransferase